MPSGYRMHWTARNRDKPKSLRENDTLGRGAHRTDMSDQDWNRREILTGLTGAALASSPASSATNSMPLRDLGRTGQIIDECARLGVHFALDDFGTGYSSLTYLKHLPVTLIKIDKSFVRDMLDDPDDLSILEGVIGLARAFKREVIAEGLETPAHGARLLQLGCELAQGYSIARPMPAAEVPHWVAHWRPDPAWNPALAQLLADPTEPAWSI